MTIDLPTGVQIRAPREDELVAISENLTGATRLYERAGMSMALVFDTYEKELRAGVDISTRILAE